MVVPIVLSETIGSQKIAARLGCLSARVLVETANDDLKTAMAEAGASILINLKGKSVADRPEIAAIRSWYRGLGKDPSRYRPSAEALTRRLIRGKELYHISNVVDVLNSISIRSGLSIGGYDIEKIVGRIVLRVGRKGEPYAAIGRGQLNIADLPVFADDLGPFGSPTSDSERTAISPTTTKIQMVLISCDPETDLRHWLDAMAKELGQYCSAADIGYEIFGGTAT